MGKSGMCLRARSGRVAFKEEVEGLYPLHQSPVVRRGGVGGVGGGVEGPEEGGVEVPDGRRIRKRETGRGVLEPCLPTGSLAKPPRRAQWGGANFLLVGIPTSPPPSLDRASFKSNFQGGGSNS